MQKLPIYYELIQSVKKRPHLYIHLEQKKLAYLEVLWSDVAVEMNIPVLDCKRHWRSLRNTYARHLQALRNGRNVKWYLENAMSFLKPHMRLRIPHPSDDTKKVTSTAIKTLGAENVTAEIKDIMDTTETTETTETNEFKQTIHEVQPNLLDSPKVKYYISSTESEEDNSASVNAISKATPTENNEFQTIASSIIRIDSGEPNEANMHFLKSLLPDINKLSDRRQRLFKSNVLLCLNNLMDEQENRN